MRKLIYFVTKMCMIVNKFVRHSLSKQSSKYWTQMWLDCGAVIDVVYMNTKIPFATLPLLNISEERSLASALRNKTNAGENALPSMQRA
jgi:membrane-anchored glycerophosphoryl diester phosphodiesterase (GDPDase)